jgi:SH3-like domain-containing protein
MHPAGGSTHPPVQVSLTGLADTERGGGTSFLSSRWLRSHKARRVPRRCRASRSAFAGTLRFRAFWGHGIGRSMAGYEACGSGQRWRRSSCCRSPPRRSAGSDAVTSGLPVPRFVSLKTDRVNVRGGPEKDHDVAFIYTRIGWPVEITAEFENWRRIRDSDGSEGWVYHSLLSGKRTAAVQLKSKTELAAACQARCAKRGDGAIAIGRARHRQAMHRNLVPPRGDGFDGWIEQNRLWGVYPDEKID